jgi:hypothetical protein
VDKHNQHDLNVGNKPCKETQKMNNQKKELMTRLEIGLEMLISVSDLFSDINTPVSESDYTTRSGNSLQNLRFFTQIKDPKQKPIQAI